MKIIILNTYDNGGAGSVLYNINDGLIKRGHSSFFIARNKTTSSTKVLEISMPFLVSWFKSLINYILNKLSPLVSNPEYYFLNERESFKYYPTKFILNKFPFTPDIILVGWVSGFVNSRNIYELKKATNAKIIYLLTDMGNLTGGCHYDMHCNGYTNDCSNCPAILNTKSKQRAYWNLKTKKKFIDLADAYVMPGSLESKNQALSSTLFKSKNVLNHILAPVDTTIFNNNKKDIAKRVFDLNPEKKIIFAGSANVSEKRKGVLYLYNALKSIEENHPELAKKSILLLVGDNNENTILDTLLFFEIKKIGFIKDERLLSLAFQASHMYASSTIYDSGPLMVKQALCCAIPIVAFNVGASKELVINGETGILCELYDVNSFANGIINLLSMDNNSYETICNNCLDRSNFTCNKEYVINEFIEIAENILT